MTQEPEQIQKQIIHVLRMYPVLNPTMLQMSLGTKIRPSFWKPIMEKMIKEGTLVRSEIVSENCFGHLHSYTCIKLADNAP